MNERRKLVLEAACAIHCCLIIMLLLRARPKIEALSNVAICRSVGLPHAPIPTTMHFMAVVITAVQNTNRKPYTGS